MVEHVFERDLARICSEAKLHSISVVVDSALVNDSIYKLRFAC